MTQHFSFSGWLANGLLAGLLAGFVVLAPGLAPEAAWAQDGATAPDAGEAARWGGDGAQRLHMNAAGTEEEWRPSLITANKVHKYLGLGSLLAASAAAMSAPDSEGAPVTNPDKGSHHNLAVAAAYMGGAAVGTGLVFHWDDFYFRDGITDPDVLHALLGVLGTAGYMVAIGEAPDSTHATAGMAGLVAMLLSVKIEW
ncbi:MAG: hypothetical protein OEW11_11590 [Nitrospirota bacterium]|nr:hypothetical protein [Nitrospirota bacterium]